MRELSVLEPPGALKMATTWHCIQSDQKACHRKRSEGELGKFDHDGPTSGNKIDHNGSPQRVISALSRKVTQLKNVEGEGSAAFALADDHIEFYIKLIQVVL